MDLRTSATNPMNLPRARTVGELIDLLAETRRLGMLGHLYKMMEELNQAQHAAGDRRVTMAPQEPEYTKQTYAPLSEVEMNPDLFMPRNLDPQVEQYFLQNVPGGIPSPEMPQPEAPRMSFPPDYISREDPRLQTRIQAPEVPVSASRRSVLRDRFGRPVSTGTGDFVETTRFR